MNRRILGIAILGVVLASSGLAANSPAKAGPPPPGASAWHYNTWIHDEFGGGCMNYTTVQHLQPIVYETTCSSANAFAVRDLSGTSWASGDQYEIADNLLDYAVGFSGGHFKLETPSLPTDTTFTNSIQNDTFWELDIAPSTGHNYPESSSEGTDLTVVTTAGQDYTNAWAFCSSTWKTCTETVDFG